MKIIFLGANGWYTSPTGDTACIVIDAEDHYVVLDAGNGLYKLDQYITEDKPISMFISHFHLDHVVGLHTLTKFDFKQGIDVYVGEGRAKDFVTLVNPPFTVGYKPQPDNVINLKTEIRLHEVSEAGQQSPFRIAAVELHHAYGDHGFVVELEGKNVAYTGDCGFTDASRKLAQGADLLICECSSKKIPQPDAWGHFDPYLAGTLAKEAGVGRMILTHFSPGQYATLEDRKWAEQEASNIFAETVAASDGSVFET